MDLKTSFKDFIINLKDEDRIAILHHTDADGITSALIAKKSIKKIKNLDITRHFHQHGGKVTIDDTTIGYVKNNSINKLIIVDMAVDHDPEKIRELERHTEILLIDHHAKASDISSRRTVAIKAEDISDIPSSRYPASKLTYDLFSTIEDITDLEWLAVIGIFGDYAQDQWQDFLEPHDQKILKKIEELIFYAAAMNGIDGLDIAYDIIDTANAPKDIVANQKLKAYEKEIESEIKDYVDNHKKEAEFDDSLDLLIYEISPKNRIKSRLINILSHELYPKKTIILIQKEGDKSYISARRQDFSISMNDLLKNALKNIPDSDGGGHVPAAGGYLPTKDIETFKKQVKEYLKKIG